MTLSLKIINLLFIVLNCVCAAFYVFIGEHMSAGIFAAVGAAFSAYLTYLWRK